MFRYFTLNDFNLKNKVVGIRVDFNSPIINNKIEYGERIKEHIKTIQYIQEKGAKIVILAHQGRSSLSDCISLKSHYELIKDKIKDLSFINEVYSENVIKKIKNLREKEVLLLENLRFLDDETNLTKKDNKITKLIEGFDYYVIDAFSVSHREQASIFKITKIPVLAGLVMEKELSNLNKIQDINKRPFVYLFGGAKPDDLIILIKDALKNNKVDLVLLTGVIGELFLINKGYNIGKKYNLLKEKNYLNVLNKVKELYDQYSDKIVLPKDVALFNGKKRVEILIKDLEKAQNKTLLNKYEIQDIGSETCNYYSSYLNDIASVYFKGPAGNFENKNFEYGTKTLIKSLEKNNAFKFLGGGHSLSAINKFSTTDKFDYVSLAGGALVHFLSGKSLPGIETLTKSYTKFEKEISDFLVVGSNVLDYRLKISKEFQEIHLGDKIKIDDNFDLSLGGGGTNVSVALSRLGAKVTYLGKFSEESKSFVLKELDKNKVKYIKTKISKKPSSKSIVMDYKSDRVIFSYRGQNNFLSIKDFSFEEIESKYAYFSSLGDESFTTLVTLAAKLKKNKHKIAFNPSLYLIQKEKVLNLVKMTNVLILNFEEAKELSGENNINSCLKKLKEYVSDLVLITDGAHGAYAKDNNETFFQRSVINCKEVIDSTGAGDCFAGTFYFFYVKGYGIKRSLELAAKNASNVICTKGAKEGLLYYDDLVKK